MELPKNITYRSVVTLVCKDHGEYKISGRNYLKGTRCEKCSYLLRARKKYEKSLLTLESRIVEIHGDKYLPLPDLSKLNSLSDKAIYTCSIHGEFETCAMNLLSNKGCTKCGQDRTRAALRKSKSYSFSEIREKIASHQIKVIDVFPENQKIIWDTELNLNCPIHGDFKKSVRQSFLRASPCSKCSKEKSGLKRRRSFDDLKAQLESINPDYTFPKISEELKHTHSEITVRCPTHGDYRATFGDYVAGNWGCPKCANRISTGEQELIDYIKSIYLGELKISARPFLDSRLEADIFLPELKIAIEFNGLYWHSTPLKPMLYHREKRELSEKSGIKLIQIWQDEWSLKRPQLESYLRNQLMVGQKKVFARKCSLTIVDSSTALDFMDKNHLQARPAASRENIALVDSENKIVALGIFRKGFTGKWELARYANLLDHSVLGGFSRIMSHWVNRHPGVELVSYVDQDKFSGGAYFKFGFKKIGESLMMSYLYKNKRHSRHSFKKSELKKYDWFDESKTEQENCIKNGILPIYNSGTLTLVYTQH